MKLSMKSLAALLMMLNGAVMASENVNTPENRQFLKQQENLSRQLREKPDHQLKAWAEKQVLENPLQRSDNHFLDELVRKQQASQDGKPRQGALYFVSFSIPEEGLKRMLGETQVKNVQLISMTLPDINAGCGGIDAYLGSFSFINGEQLQRFVKQIMSNAAGYFFDLALQTTVPEIKTAKDFVQKMASDINSMNLSSCQAAQGIIGGLFPRTQVSQQKVCQDIAGESNIFADWAASRQGCTVGGKSDSVRDKASDKDKERVTKNINIMWNALSKNRMFDGNKELKEFVMTLTGSLVFGPNGEITPLSARTTDRSIIRAMMEGGTAKIYHCNDSDKCLKVVADTPVTISRDNALKSQITKLLASIQNKAVSDTPLDDKEKGFISSTTIPVFKYLVDPQMLGVSNSMIYQLTDYIGYDILLQYIQELLQQARAMVATGNYDEAVIGHINDNMNDATRQIAAFQSQVQVQQDALLVVDRQMSYMRQQLSARMLSRYQNNYHFGGSTL